MRITQLGGSFGAFSLILAFCVANAEAVQAQKSVRPPVKNNVGNGPATFAKDASGITGGPKTTTAFGSAGAPKQITNGSSGFATNPQGQGAFPFNGNNNPTFPGNFNGPYPVPYPVLYPQPYPYIAAPFPGQYSAPYPYASPMPYYSPYQHPPFPQYPSYQQYAPYPQNSPYNQIGNGVAPNHYTSPSYGYPPVNPFGTSDMSPYGGQWQGNRPPVFPTTDSFGIASPFGMGFGFRGVWN